MCGSSFECSATDRSIERERERMDNEESLLQKENYLYVEGCPGCEVDRQKQMQRGLPLKQLLTVWIIVLATGN